MTFEIAIVFIIVIGAVILFITEKLSVDLVALIAMALLLLAGILSPEEGVSGFSNDATVTIAALYILSTGLFKTGIVNYIARVFVKIFKNNFWLFYNFIS